MCAAFKLCTLKTQSKTPTKLHAQDYAANSMNNSSLIPVLWLCSQKSYYNLVVTRTTSGGKRGRTSCFFSQQEGSVSLCVPTVSQQSLPPAKLPRCNDQPASLNHIKPHRQEASVHCYYWDKDPVFSTALLPFSLPQICCLPRKRTFTAVDFFSKSLY